MSFSRSLTETISNYVSQNVLQVSPFVRNPCSAVKLRHDVHVQPYETWHFRWSFDASELFDSSYLILSIDDKPIPTPPWTTKTVPGPNLVVVVSPLTPQPTLTV